MSEARSWIERVERRIHRWRAMRPADAWVVAVSGGGDSVGLLRILHRLAPTIGLRLTVAHLDHGARGEAGRADATFVAELASSMGMTFDLGRWEPSRTGHFEADARRARYDWLVEVARRRGAGFVAVGHTRDDQAETILHRIVRGTGPRGLAGIPRLRRLADDPPIDLVRPMLDASRAGIRDYLSGLGQPHREDATNADGSRTCARIRHGLLPALAREYNPDIVGAIVRLGALARSSGMAHDARLLEAESSAVVAAAADRVVLDGDALRALPRFLRTELIRRAWRGVGWPEQGMSEHRWRRLSRLALGGQATAVTIGAGVSASTDGRSLILSRSASPPELPLIEPIALECPGEAPIPWAGGRIIVGGESGHEVIDRDNLAPPLEVRGPRPGDRFAPLGMDGRSRPLADFFRGRGVPRDRRATTPIVCDRIGIVWVVGHRIADRVRLTQKTRHSLTLGWIEDDGIPLGDLEATDATVIVNDA